MSDFTLYKSKPPTYSPNGFYEHYGVLYGVSSAVIINYMAFHINYNKKHDEFKINGKTWVCQSFTEMHKQISYLTVYTIKKSIKQLLEKDVLVVANHSPDKMNRTQWYAFKDEDEFL